MAKMIANTVELEDRVCDEDEEDEGIGIPRSVRLGDRI